jgi:CheY-like chemotaxis protein
MDDKSSPHTKDYLERIMENADWLLLIINDILDISKVESGKIILEHIPFDLHEILAHCQTTIMPKAMEKGTQLHFYAEPSIGRRLLGDPTRLRQIITNFLSNAVKFTHVGTVKLSSTITGSTENTVTIQFEIRDSGIGMTPEQMEIIFEPFMQADATTTRKYGGTGLGLSITKNLIELMGGKLNVESTVGLGSKFSFSLIFDTIDISAETNDHKITRTTWLEKPVFEGEILVCEDNTMNQRVIREYLARVGLKTVIAENGKDGVEIVHSRKEKNEKPFDLIFMDIHMPVMDGLEAALKINELQTGTPIVAMTADIMSNDKELYRQNGMPDHMGKPFTSQELWRCLLKYLTPVKREEKKKSMQIEDDMELQKILQSLFAKNNQKKFSEITGALEAGDIKLAHRLAHTLKGNAGQIGRAGLQLAAAGVEQALKNGENLVTKEQLTTLETELYIVLNELMPLLNNETATLPQSSMQATGQEVRSLIEKLEPLLESGNAACLDLVNDLRAIPECEWLAQQIEDFDFESALSTLAKIKERMV